MKMKWKMKKKIENEKKNGKKKILYEKMTGCC